MKGGLFIVIEDVIRHYHEPEKDLQSNKPVPPSNNVNACLNFLTIDDIIYRLAWNNGMRDITAVEYNTKYKQLFGGKAFGGKTVLVRAGIDVPVDSNGCIAGVERIRRAIPTLENFRVTERVWSLSVTRDVQGSAILLSSISMPILSGNLSTAPGSPKKRSSILVT